MARASSPDQINAERRKRVLVGTLPTDFLRISQTSQQQQEAADQQAALALHHQLIGNSFLQNPTGRLNITIAQAKLVKNYGFPRMDPYVRLRVGHIVYETHTDSNGGKTPRWNKVLQCLLPQGVNCINIEIYDERSFTPDELVAWANINIPQAVLAGETHENWYPLSGKQGDGKEGMISLVLSYSSGTGGLYPHPYVGDSGPVGPPVVMVPSTGQNVFGIPQYTPVSVYTQLPVQTPQFSEQHLSQIEEMFPNVDKEVVRSVYEANRFNKDATVNSLLQMSEIPL